MNIIEKKMIYAGCEEINTHEAIQVEIYGLKNLIRQAEERISRLEQAILIAQCQQKERENTNESTDQRHNKEKNG